MPFFARSPNVKIFYEINGPFVTATESQNQEEIQNVIFIMGLVMEGSAWSHQVTFFSEREYRCLTLDNRGIGQSSAPWGIYSTDQMAEDAKLLLEHVGWTQFHIVGISMGGMIAQHLACQLVEAGQSHKIKSLTLFATHAGGRSALVPFSGFKLLMGNLFDSRGDVRHRTERLMKLLYSSKTRADPVKYQQLFDYHVSKGTNRKFALSGILGQLLAVSQHFVSANRLMRLRFTHFPILVVVGTEDVLVRECNSVILSQITGGELLILDDLGHALLSEDAHLVNSELQKHFRLSQSYSKQFIPVRQLRNTAAEGNAEPCISVTCPNPQDFYAGEKAILDKCCHHKAQCGLQVVKRMLHGSIVGLLINILKQFLVQRHQVKDLNFARALQSARLLGSVTGLLVSLRCMLKGLNARLAARSFVRSPSFFLGREETARSLESQIHLYKSQQRWGFPSEHGLEWPVVSGCLLFLNTLSLYQIGIKRLREIS